MIVLEFNVLLWTNLKTKVEKEKKIESLKGMYSIIVLFKARKYSEQCYVLLMYTYSFSYCIKICRGMKNTNLGSFRRGRKSDWIRERYPGGFGFIYKALFYFLKFKANRTKVLYFI